MPTLPDDKQTLEALFEIEIADSEKPAVALNTILCAKCNGRGNFVGYTGRVVGKCFACDGAGLKPTADTPQGDAIDVGAIAKAFSTAHQNGIKRPKLRIDVFCFSRAPDTGKNAGSIYVKEGERYLGKVTDGKFHATRDCEDNLKARIIACASDPATHAKAFGLRTGTCSCCGRTLTNKDSIDLGIGPICAESFGF